jgi:hypothetical protein
MIWRKSLIVRDDLHLREIYEHAVKRVRNDKRNDNEPINDENEPVNEPVKVLLAHMN